MSTQLVYWRDLLHEWLVYLAVGKATVTMYLFFNAIEYTTEQKKSEKHVKWVKGNS